VKTQVQACGGVKKAGEGVVPKVNPGGRNGPVSAKVQKKHTEK